MAKPNRYTEMVKAQDVAAANAMVQAHTAAQAKKWRRNPTISSDSDITLRDLFTAVAMARGLSTSDALSKAERALDLRLECIDREDATMPPDPWERIEEEA